ncbi:hypothetical protein HK100_012196 [Physocladia obscura]|uniref:Uncharacterized protein n=1 Tax=Physocladia obscura TaxID=109957 RepID=A0AAD5T2P2_9FUNG|nr:hypothetical protein HK100_012196 [Physocladia obscura]
MYDWPSLVRKAAKKSEHDDFFPKSKKAVIPRFVTRFCIKRQKQEVFTGRTDEITGNPFLVVDESDGPGSNDDQTSLFLSVSKEPNILGEDSKVVFAEPVNNSEKTWSWSDSDTEDEEFIAVSSSPHSNDSLSSENSFTEILKPFLKRRDSSTNSVLPSGKEQWLKVAEHSWMLNIDSDSAMMGFSEDDKLHIRKPWATHRLSEKNFSAVSHPELNADYASCKKELEYLELMFSRDADCEELYTYLLSGPILREGESLKNFEFWMDDDITVKEAEYFRNLWDKVFSIRPTGIKTTPTETTMKPSKFRKLNTKERTNIRGLESDVSWQSKTGIILCWGEGQPGDWTDNRLEAESALKSLKGAKDCIDDIIRDYGHNVEIFSMTLLGLFPLNFQGFLIVTQILKNFLGFLVSLNLALHFMFT